MESNDLNNDLKENNPPPPGFLTSLFQRVFIASFFFSFFFAVNISHPDIRHPGAVYSCR